ncbi:MFS transporter [Pseudonocardia sp. HH130630-07]|uniref:MFS transporter n=1 Tax=Pseudonocardia sp. HH130630-07 TaxID=1690815 RepID=UPI00081507B0|nr:MFS transporter [Pseudonocardia sp. HH130630-07]ANY09326.1 hypothetical protein AFB00_27240 [Pseudonocardia sp. HH130630-07]
MPTTGSATTGPRRRGPLTVALGASELVTWGVLVYAFSALAVPMGADLGWSPAVFSMVYTVGTLVSGASGVVVGRWMQRHSPHGVMLAGTLLACAVLVGWSLVDGVGWFLVVFAAAGVAMSATLYEPAFALTAAWFEEPARARAVAVVTLFGGLAATVFVPLAGVLATHLGWRTALLALAAVVALTAVPLQLVLLRAGRHPARAQPRPRILARTPDRAPAPVRTASFRWLALALGLSTAVKYGVVVILVAYLVARGYPLDTAAALAGGIGLLQVVGRFATAVTARWVSGTTLSAGLFALQGVALLGLAAAPGSGTARDLVVVASIAAFGLGAGQGELLRGTLVVTLYGREDYPRVNGVLSVFVMTARALGPFVMGALAAAGGGYTRALTVGAGLALGAAVTLPVAVRRHRDEAGGAPA